MKQPSLKERKEYADIVGDSVSIVPIKGTKRSVRLRWLKPYTIERITDVWIERDLASARIGGGPDVLKDLVKESYFAFKEAALMILNNDLKIRFFYPFYWRWLAHRYDETQMADIIAEGKKKLPLTAHYEVMVYMMDMRTDWMKMTAKEVEQYHRELLSVVKQPLSRSFPPMESLVGGSADGNGISGTGAS